MRSSRAEHVVSGAHFKDLAIKLFGRTIPLPESPISAAAVLHNLDGCNNLKKAEQSVSGAEDSCPSERSSVLVGDNEDNQASNVTANREELEEPHLKEEQEDTNDTDQERVFKKPDKIIPCPRCNSLETKFCYFNNYNVNQPRHFCKNCQRYWTAGGTMRNVPIGAGRRRNKQLASQYRQIIVSSEGVATTRLETSDTTNHHQLLTGVESPPAFRPSAGNGTVLKFGPEAPLCDSMETVLSLGDQKRSIEIGSAYCGDSPEEPSSCGSSMTTTSIHGNELPKSGEDREAVRLSGSSSEIAASNVHCYPIPQLVFPLNQGGNGIISSAMAQSSDSMSVPNASSSSHPNSVQWLPATMLAVPGFCTPSLPLQFVPASCWGCTPVWTAAGAGKLAVHPSDVCGSQTSPATISSCPTSSSSPTLGKHSRDANSLTTEEEKSEKCIVVPKTLRVDNPSEAARSPIWTTFGIRPCQNETISKGNVFETSETNADGKSHFREAPHNILEAKTSGSFYSLL